MTNERDPFDPDELGFYNPTEKPEIIIHLPLNNAAADDFRLHERQQPANPQSRPQPQSREQSETQPRQQPRPQQRPALPAAARPQSGPDQVKKNKIPLTGVALFAAAGVAATIFGGLAYAGKLSLHGNGGHDQGPSDRSTSTTSTASAPASPPALPGGTAGKPGKHSTAPAVEIPANCKDWNITPAEKAALSQAISRVATKEILDTKLSPGATIAVGCGPETLAAMALGTTDGVHKPSVELTNYDASSLYKFEVAATAEIMADKGIIHTSDKMGKYMSTWRKGAKSKVTIDMMLRHLSGLPDSDYDTVIANTPAKTWQNVYNVQPVIPPDTRNIYSNVAYDNLGTALAIAANKPMSQLVEQYLFKPLDMKHSGFEGQVKNCAPTSLDADQSSKLVCKPQDRLVIAEGGKASHAGGFNTTGDLEILAGTLANGGMYKSVPIFSKRALASFTDPMDGKGYGAGTNINGKDIWKTLKNGKKVLKTPASCGDQLNQNAFCKRGYDGTQLMVDPRSGLWSVIQANSSYHHVVNEGAMIPAMRDINDTLVRETKPRA